MGAQLSGTDRSPSPGRPIGSNSSRITSGSADSCITDACARMLVRMRHSRLGPEGMFVCMRHSRLGRAGRRSRPAPPAPLPRTIRTAGGTRCRGPRHRARSCAHYRTWAPLSRGGMVLYYCCPVPAQSTAAAALSALRRKVSGGVQRPLAHRARRDPLRRATGGRGLHDKPSGPVPSGHATPVRLVVAR